MESYTDSTANQMNVDETPLDYDYVCKIVLIGTAGVGKTSIFDRFKTGQFCERDTVTVAGNANCNKIVTVDGKKVMINLWDTAGQERFRSLTQSYYRKSYGVLIVYDITNQNTYNEVASWIDTCDEYTKNIGGKLCKVLLGNKSDLDTSRVISPDDGEETRYCNGLDKFFETSAKDPNNNINQIFEYIARCFLETVPTRIKSGVVDLTNHTTQVSLFQKLRNRCC